MLGGAIFSKFKILSLAETSIPVHNQERSEFVKIVSFELCYLSPALSTKHFFVCNAPAIYESNKVTKLQLHSSLWFTGNGWYVYIEASEPRKPNDTAKLISSSVAGTTASGGKCLSFWYHMYGADINTLSVYVRTGAYDTLLWSKTGTRGDKWIQALVSVNSRTRFQVLEYS